MKINKVSTIKFDKTSINIFYLFILRACMFLFPLISMPYLVNALGVANYGILSFIQTVSTYIILFINYGFNLSAPREIAINKDDNKIINNIFCTVISVKILLLVVSIPIILLFAWIIPIINANYTIFLLIIIALISEVFFTNWFYQGIEEMRSFTLINIITRLIGLILLFICVHTPDDLFIAYLIISSTTLLGSLIGFIIILKKYKLKLYIPKRIDLKKQIYLGWDLFIAQSATTLFSNSNILIIGLLLKPEDVGFYSVAEKIMRTVSMMVGPVSSGLYPVTANLFKKSRVAAIKYLKRFLVIGGMLFFTIAIIMIVFSDYIILIVTGEENLEIKHILILFSVIPLSIYVNNIYGTQIMLNINREKIFKYLITINGLCLPILSYVLTLNFNLLGAAYSLLIMECLLTISMLVYVEFFEKKGFIGGGHG